VHHQNRYLLTQFLDGEHVDKLNICSVYRQAENERISAIFSTIFVGLERVRRADPRPHQG